MYMRAGKKNHLGQSHKCLVFGIGRYFELIYGTFNALLASVDGVFFSWADIFALLA